MQVRHGRVAGISRIADLLALSDAVAHTHDRPVFHQVVVLAGRPVAVQDDDVVGVLAAAVLPASLRMRFFDTCDDSCPGGVHGRADGHVEIDRKFLESGMTESRTVALNDPVGVASCVGERIEVIVVMNGVLVANSPVERITIAALALRGTAAENHDLLRLIGGKRSRYSPRPVHHKIVGADMQRVGNRVLAQVLRAQFDITALVHGIDAYPFIHAIRMQVSRRTDHRADQ